MDGPSRQTQADKLISEIADAILAGTLAPGTRLDEQMLADRYAVSRTPVREAIRQLASTGLVEVRPRRSAVVAEITAEHLETMFIAMGELEATCARLSAIRMTPIERRRLQVQHARMAALVEDDDVAGFAEANHVFHGLIYAGTHNSILSDMATALRRRLGPYRRAQFRSPGRLPRSQAEHETVTLAILSGDAAAAHAAMLNHVSLVEDAFSRLAAAHAA
ncbi:GntR family transcriptional regulator [uncultured Methylobacterium sp.]|uniref:GntR family transcriptional regulator n=1 Tax=uncultured Methylobacterium sp. TaxID=157278 RepID=UPI0035C943EC